MIDVPQTDVKVCFNESDLLAQPIVNTEPSMSHQAVKALLDLLDIERIEVDLFRGQSPSERASQRVFGGQVIAQALVAAYRTVEDRHCHSLHAYFIRPGDPKVPIIYQVDHSRDGRSFTTRRIVAIQHGKQIFNMAASFHVAEEGWHHQHEMPETEGPENLETLHSQRLKIADRIPESFREDFTRERAIETRHVDPIDLFNPGKQDDHQKVWVRVADKIGDDIGLHHCLMAYASDMALLGTGARPHGITWLSGKMMSASLDHAMWFHAPTRFDDWHLYEMDSPYAGGARSFNRGKIYNANGQLVVSVAQEGLMRPIRKKSKD